MEIYTRSKLKFFYNWQQNIVKFKPTLYT